MTTIHHKNLISIVIPVYNNCETISETCSQIFQTKQKNFPHLGIEILFVEDGSQDDSWQELQRIRAAYPEHISLIKLSRNFGQLSAILAGYESAQGDAIITISADLQDPINIMAQMVSFWESGQEIVIAHRESRDDDIISTLFSHIAYGIAKWANPRIPKGGFDYLLLSRRAVNILNSFKGRHRFFQGDILWLGLPTTLLPYTRKQRKYGKSGWTFTKKIKYFIDLILDSSYLPIRIMSALGFLAAFTGLLYALIIFYAWLQHQTPFTGWSPIMIILLIIGGLIMMMLGIIGEYLWRIYDDIKHRPLYIIEQSLRTNSEINKSV